MIKCCTVSEYGSFNKVGTVLEKTINRLNDAGYKILNVFETKVTKIPHHSDQAFIILYDDGEKSGMNDEEKDIKDKAIDLYNALAMNDSSGCELKLTEGYHMIVTISRTVEFPEFEPLKEEQNEEE